ncbi:uncharacterized protein LOC126832201 isoform X1 [Patella vulgata]|uniref:uncharacterized protein LOC126832201 isoform X1 n=1 Tax=Patella vulgata TaxID=6465 RepID=UPI00217FF39F|nr:uncharacterized protein LOC126832201 isoform X1 [Patella vulgata]XP_050418873.1 uncharacterized protein LOC126832201 isoform X1 [Patella vulgata]XP_050418874.1 uncharacterized protein LOC126832201 isoform X1 [Patella vulgata]
MSKVSRKCVAIVIAVSCILIISVALIATSIKTLSSAEVAIFYNRVFLTLRPEPYYEGLYTGPPGFEFIIYPNTFTTKQFYYFKCLNAEGITMELNVEYQYKAEIDSLQTIMKDFKDFDDYKEILEDEGEAALQNACSNFNTSQFQSERGAFQGVVRARLQERYTQLFCTVTGVQVNNIMWPSSYEIAIRSTETAREDIRVAASEQPRLLTEADTEILQAKTQAQIILDKAESDARVRKNKADSVAQAITAQFEKEGESYSEILSNQGLSFSQQGLISYIGSRVIAASKSPVYINLGTPAKTSYVTNP